MMVARRPGIVFGPVFCSELVPLLDVLRQNDQVDTANLSQFQLNLAVKVRTAVVYRSVKFRVAFGTPTVVISQFLDVCAFEEEPGDDGLVESEDVRALLELVVPRLWYSNRDRRSTLHWIAGKHVQLTFSHQGIQLVKFKVGLDNAYCNKAVLSVLPWSFEPEKTPSELPVKILFVSMHVASTFMPLREYLGYFHGLILEHLSLEQIEWFVRANSDSYVVTGHRRETVSADSSLFDYLSQLKPHELENVSLEVGYVE